jgi:hypothetical protein
MGYMVNAFDERRERQLVALLPASVRPPVPSS